MFITPFLKLCMRLRPKLLQACLSLLLICLSCACLPGLASQPTELRVIPALAARLVPGAHVGVMVQDADSGAWLYQSHAYDYFVPASNHKWLVATASLLALGKDWRYHTTVHALSKPQGRWMRPDLWLSFTGDPSFTEANLKALLQQVRRQGFHHVRRIVLDDRHFSGPDHAPGWMLDDLPWAYAAPAVAVNMDENKIPIHLHASRVLGGATRVQMNAGQKKQLIAATIKTVSESDAMTHCALQIAMDHSNRLRLSGCWPIEPAEQTLQLAIQHPKAHMQARLAKLLREVGLQVDQGLVWAKSPMPKHAKKIAQHDSPPLHEMLGTLMRDSNNLYADSLLKTLGWELAGKGSYQEGVYVMKRTLAEKLDHDLSDHAFYDGSGASRYNHMTPAFLARLLYVIYHDQALSDVLLPALPVADTSGTLQHRMGSFDLKHHVKAKTGSMHDVSTLAGYIQTHSGRHLNFVIFLNGLSVGTQAAKDLQSRICQLLYHL